MVDRAFPASGALLPVFRPSWLAAPLIIHQGAGNMEHFPSSSDFRCHGLGEFSQHPPMKVRKAGLTEQSASRHPLH